MRAPTPLITLAIAAVVAGGCQMIPIRRLQQATSAGSLVWPYAPHAPRIRFVSAIACPDDVGIQPSLFGRVGEVLLGKRQERFVRPSGVAADGSTLYVADPGAQSLWIINPTARRFQQIREAGRRRLASPVAVAVGSKGRVYLVDSYLASVFVYDVRGRLTATIAPTTFQRPSGLAYDAARNRLYVADSAAHCVWIMTGDGIPQGRIGQRGVDEGAFNFPTHVAVDRQGLVYVTDALGFRVQFFSPEGKCVGQFGRHGDMSGEFAMPKGIAVDHDGHIYVVDALFDAVQIFDREGRLLLAFGERGVAVGQFWLPGGLYIDAQDHIFVTDAYNQRVQIFEYLAGAPE